MRAVVLPSADAAPRAADFPSPQAQPGEQEVTLVGAGVHQVMKALASGRHYGSTGAYPLVPGVDAVARTSAGDLVYTGFARSPWGTMAEQMTSRIALPLPDGADPLAVAAGLNPAMSGFLPLETHLEQRGKLDTVLVLGATGMAGRAAVQSALALGASAVIAVGRDAEALSQRQDLGARAVSIADGTADLDAAVARSTPSLVLDFVWGPVAEAAFAALRTHGLEDDQADISYVQIGSLAGEDAAVPGSLLRSRRITLRGSGAGSVGTEHLMAKLPRLIGMIADGTIDVPYTAYPFSRVEEAWRHPGRDRAVVVPD